MTRGIAPTRTILRAVSERVPAIFKTTMNDDAELLRLYVQNRSEEAFAAIVQRHLNLVYSVALRQVGGDMHLAQDVAQVVFSSLAQKACMLSHRSVLGGWLYRATQFAAIDVVRAESRRRVRESESRTMHDLTAPSEVDKNWDKLRPTLDELIGDLKSTDRDAVVLRFFETRSFSDIGARLQLTENAARMRVDRALDKLRLALARRGVTSTSAALAATLASQVGAAAPAECAVTLVSGALAGVARSAGVTAGTTFFGLMTTSKIALPLVTTCAFLAGGAALFEANALNDAQAALVMSATEQAGLRAQLRNLEAHLTEQSQRAIAAEADTATLLTAVQSVKTAQSEVAPITHDLVKARYDRAKQLAKSGDATAALREFLWCFDEGMPRVSGFGGVRRSYVLSEIARLAENNPEALSALQQRRDAAEKRLLASVYDFDASQDFASINRVLKDDARTLRLHDQLSPGDRRRPVLGSDVFGLLVNARRYDDAIAARSYDRMGMDLDTMQKMLSPVNPMKPDPRAVESMHYIVNSAAQDVEVLAGTSDLFHAKSLSERLLKYDSSADTKATLQMHLARVGHPDLLNPVTK